MSAIDGSWCDLSDVPVQLGAILTAEMWHFVAYDMSTNPPKLLVHQSVFNTEEEAQEAAEKWAIGTQLYKNQVPLNWHKR